MKLQRKENQLTLKQLRFSSRVDRMQKKVDKRQKYYDKLRKQIERQANCYKNSMNMQISNKMGLGTNSVNLMNPYGSNGAAMSILARMSAADMNRELGLDGSAKNGFKLSESVAKAIASGTLQINNSQKEIEYNGKKIPAGALFDGYTGELIKSNGKDDATQIGQAYQQLQQMAQVRVSQMQTQAQNMKSCYENNVSIWQEAMLEELEAQEEWEMDMLAEEQADMEAEKNSVEVQLQRVQEEKKSIEQALGQAIQDSAPKFGLA